MSLSVTYLLQFVCLKSLAIRTAHQVTSKWPFITTKDLSGTNQLEFRVLLPTLLSYTPALMEFSPPSVSDFKDLIH